MTSFEQTSTFSHVVLVLFIYPRGDCSSHKILPSDKRLTQPKSTTQWRPYFGVSKADLSSVLVEKRPMPHVLIPNLYFMAIKAKKVTSCTHRELS